MFDEPERFEFFQAIRLLEKLYSDKVPIGIGSTPRNELVRLRGNPSLSFPASQLNKLETVYNERTNEESIRLTINFMGMIGIVGVLPTHYSELIIERARYNDTTLWDFTDIFTHRAVSLFYRAWEKYRFPVQYERGNDNFTSYLFDFVGLGTEGIRGNMDLDDEALLPYAGLIIQKPHSSTALSQIVTDYFRTNAKIQQFFGQWLDLDSESISRLGKANSQLGESSILGSRIWDQQSKFRLVLGAMSFKQFAAFLPNGSAHNSLLSIIKLMTGLELDFDIQLVLKKEEVPGCVLTTRALRRPMLGFTSWLKSKPFSEDDSQVILQTV